VGLDALVLPGGESGAHLRILKENGLFAGLRSFHAGGGALFGTCAGMILLAKGVSGPAQDSLGLIDIDVERNAYGRQIDSFEADGDVQAGEVDVPSVRMVFIRAPRVTRVGPAARVLLRHQGEPVAVSEGRVLVSAFHPEMAEDSRLHAFFLDSIAKAPLHRAAVSPVSR
jgi:5'-phosphate synthase pdxT subunit